MVFRFFRSILGARTTAAAIGQGFFANGLLLLLNVVTGVITARALGPEGRGEVAALVAVPTFVCFLAPLGLSPAIVFESRSDKPAADHLSATVLVLALALGCAAVAAAFALTPWLLTEHQATLVSMAVPLSAFALPGVLANLGMARLQGAGEFTACNIVRMAQPLLALLALLALTASATLTPLRAALVTFCSGFPGLLWNWWLIRPRNWPKLADLRSSFAELYAYAARASVGEFLAGLAGQLDKIVVVALYSPREVGLFAVAMSLSRILLVAPQAATQVLLSRTSGKAGVEILATVTRSAAVTLATVILGATVLGIAGPSLLSLLYSKTFADGSGLLQVLLLEAALTAMHQVLSQPFLALDRPGALGLQQATGTAVSLGLLFSLAAPFGISGAAWALLGGAAARLALALAMYPVVLRLPVPKVFRELGPSLSLLAERLRGGTL